MSKPFKRARVSRRASELLYTTLQIVFYNSQTMASNVDWEEILRDRYATFKVEEQAFLDSLKICNSTEISTERIYDAIKGDPDVPANLKLMYREAVFGTNQQVKNRIKNRLGNIRRHVRQDLLY